MLAMTEVTARLNSCPSLSSTASSCSLVPPSPHEPVDVLGAELLDEALVGVDAELLGSEQQDEALVGVDAELLGAEQQDEALVGVELLGGDAVAVEVPMVAMTRRPMGKIRKLSRTEEKIEMVQVLFVCMYTVHCLHVHCSQFAVFRIMSVLHISRSCRV
jgi:hypothetical protein